MTSFRIGAPNRRGFLTLAAGASLLPMSGFLSRGALAAGPIKTAAIYTVPVEQQWVSRIHKAAMAARPRSAAISSMCFRRRSRTPIMSA